MSANNPFDRRLRNLADRRDNEEENQEEEPDRQVRPGRGATEDRVVERDASPAPDPDPEPTPSPDPSPPQRRPDRGARPEPEPDPAPAPEPQPVDTVGGDGLLNRAAEGRDREIIEEVAAEEEELARADRDLREAADQQDVEDVFGGSDGTLRSELREDQRRQERIEQEEGQFDQTLQRAQEAADREAFEEARGDIIESRLDTEESLRDAGEEGVQDLQTNNLIARDLQADSEVDVIGELEDASARISETFDEFVSQDVRLGTDPTAVALGVQEEFTRDITPQEQAAVRSNLALLNAPGTARGLIGVGQFAEERRQEIAEGEFQEAQTQTEQAIGQGIDAIETEIQERPLQFGGAVVGSLALSSGAFAAARAVGPRTGAATRALIQPGEELLGEVGGRTTRLLAGERAADLAFPQNEPIFFSEEAALRGIERGAAGISDIAGRTRVRGFGAGFPALEIEAEQEPAPEDFRELDPRDPLARPERNERMRERARNRGADRRDLGPNVRARRRPTVEFEPESELAREIDAEIEAEERLARFQIGAELQAPEAELLNLETEFELGRELGREAELELESETEAETEAELEAEAEAELERELETETETEQELEAELFGLDPGFAEESTLLQPGLEGVRTVEATLIERELDVE